MRDSRHIALGGILGALAIVIMCLGGLIPFATYICPMLCVLTLQIVVRACGNRIGWAWYGAVALLSLLIGPDKEAAAVFVFLGYYPMIKPKLDNYTLGWFLKFVLFNASSAAAYGSLIWILGMGFLLEEFLGAGIGGLILTISLGNLCFYMMDLLLCRISRLR